MSAMADAPFPGAPARGGFSLMEMLAVMAIIGVLLGISLGGLSRTSQGTALDGGIRMARSALQMARHSARDQGALARVLFMPGDPSQVRLELARDAVSMGFGESSGGRVLAGRNRFAALGGATVVAGGSVRNCAEFDGQDTIVVDPADDLNPQRGFVLTMDVWPDSDPMGGELASFGRLFQWKLEENGAVQATFEIDGQGSSLELKTAPGVVAKEAWVRLELAFDGFEALLRVHGVIEATKKVGDANVPLRRLAEGDVSDRLRLGGRGFHGFLDEINYRTMEEAEVIELERGVRLDMENPIEVRFDSEGRLDPRLHTAPLSIPVRLEDERRELKLDLSGVVR
jgi:prepilin-type N-terminal cleavage/methylation domain-containing protein